MESSPAVCLSRRTTFKRTDDTNPCVKVYATLGNLVQVYNKASIAMAKIIVEEYKLLQSKLARLLTQRSGIAYKKNKSLKDILIEELQSKDKILSQLECQLSHQSVPSVERNNLKSSPRDTTPSPDPASSKHSQNGSKYMSKEDILPHSLSFLPPIREEPSEKRQPSRCIPVESLLEEEERKTRILMEEKANLMKRLTEMERRTKPAQERNRKYMEKNIELTTAKRQLEDRLKSLEEDYKKLKEHDETGRRKLDHVTRQLTKERSVKEGLEYQTSEIEELQKKVSELNKTVASLKQTCSEKDRRIELIQHRKKRRRLERSQVTLAGMKETFYGYDEDNQSMDSELSSMSTSLDDDTWDEFAREQLEQNYHRLSKEHLELEKSYALLHSQSDIIQDPQREQNSRSVLEADLFQAQCKIEQLDKFLKLSGKDPKILDEIKKLKADNDSLISKISELRDSERQLRRELEESKEREEELEFKFLEIEESEDEFQKPLQTSSPNKTSRDEDGHLLSQVIQDAKLQGIEFGNLLQELDEAKKHVDVAGSDQSKLALLKAHAFLGILDKTLKNSCTDPNNSLRRRFLSHSDDPPYDDSETTTTPVLTTRLTRSLEGLQQRQSEHDGEENETDPDWSTKNDLTTQLTSAQKRIIKLENVFHDVSKAVEVYRERLNMTDSARQTQQAELEVLRSQFRRLSEDPSYGSEMLTERLAKLETAERRASEFEKTSWELQAKVISLQQDKQRLEERLESSDTGRIIILAEDNEVQAEMEKLREKITSCEKSETELMEKNLFLEKEISKSRSTNCELTNHVEYLSAEIKKLKSDSEGKLWKDPENLQTSQEEINSLHAELNEKNKELDHVKKILLDGDILEQLGNEMGLVKEENLMLKSQLEEKTSPNGRRRSMDLFESKGNNCDKQNCIALAGDLEAAHEIMEQLRKKLRLAEDTINDLESSEGELRDNLELTEKKESDYRKRISNLQKTIRELRDQLVDRDIIEESLQQKVESLVGLESSRSSRITELESIEASLRHRLEVKDELEHDLDLVTSLEATVEDLQIKNQELREKVDEYEESETMLKQNWKAVAEEDNSRIMLLEEKIRTLSLTNHQLKNKLQQDEADAALIDEIQHSPVFSPPKMSSRSESNLDDVGRNVATDDTSAKVEELENRLQLVIEEKNSKIEALQEKLDDVRETEIKLSETLFEMEQEEKHLRAKLALYENSVVTVENMARYEDKLEEMRSSEHDLLTRMSSLENREDDLKDCLLQTESKYKAEVERLEKQISNYQTLEERLLTKIQELQSQNKDLEIKSKAAKSSNAPTSPRIIPNNDQEIESLKTRVRDLRVKVSTLEKQNSELKNKLEEITKERDELLASSKELKTRLVHLESLEDKVDMLQKAEIQFSERVSVLKEANTQLEKKLSDEGNLSEHNKVIEAKLARLEYLEEKVDVFQDAEAKFYDRILELEELNAGLENKIQSQSQSPTPEEKEGNGSLSKSALFEKNRQLEEENQTLSLLVQRHSTMQVDAENLREKVSLLERAEDKLMERVDELETIEENLRQQLAQAEVEKDTNLLEEKDHNKDEINKLQALVGEWEEKYYSLSIKLESVQNSYNDLELSFGDLQKSNTDLQKSYEEAKKLNDQLKKSQEELQESNSKFKKSNDELQNLHENLQKSHKNLQRSQEGLQKSNEELKQLYDQLSESYNDLQKSYTDVQNSSEDLQKSHDDLQQLHNELSKSYDELQKSHDELFQLHEKHSKSNDQLLKSYDGLKQSYDNLLELHDQLSISHDSLQQANSRIEKSFNNLQQMYDKLNKSHENLQMSNSEILKSRDEIQGPYEDLKKSHENIVQLYEDLDTILHKSHEDLKNSYDQLQKSYEDLQESNDDLQKSCDDLEEKVKMLLLTEENLTQSLSIQQVKETELEADLETSEDKVNELLLQRESLQNKLDQLKVQEPNNNNNTDELQAELEATQEKLEEVQSEYEEKIEELSEEQERLVTMYEERIAELIDNGKVTKQTLQEDTSVSVSALHEKLNSFKDQLEKQLEVNRIQEKDYNKLSTENAEQKEQISQLEMLVDAIKSVESDCNPEKGSESPKRFQSSFTFHLSSDASVNDVSGGDRTLEGSETESQAAIVQLTNISQDSSLEELLVERERLLLEIEELKHSLQQQIYQNDRVQKISIEETRSEFVTKEIVYRAKIDQMNQRLSSEKPSPGRLNAVEGETSSLKEEVEELKKREKLYCKEIENLHKNFCQLRQSTQVSRGPLVTLPRKNYTQMSQKELVETVRELEGEQTLLRQSLEELNEQFTLFREAVEEITACLKEEVTDGSPGVRGTQKYHSADLSKKFSDLAESESELRDRINFLRASELLPQKRTEAESFGNNSEIQSLVMDLRERVDTLQEKEKRLKRRLYEKSGIGPNTQIRKLYDRIIDLEASESKLQRKVEFLQLSEEDLHRRLAAAQKLETLPPQKSVLLTSVLPKRDLKREELQITVDQLKKTEAALTKQVTELQRKNEDLSNRVTSLGGSEKALKRRLEFTESDEGSADTMYDKTEEALGHRVRELEKIEKQLKKQVSELEQDREELHQITSKDKSMIHQKNMQIKALQLSEKGLKDQVNKLEVSERVLNVKVETLEEQVETLEDALHELKSKQTKYQDILKKFKLDGEFNAAKSQNMVATVEELSLSETALKKRVQELELKNSEIENKSETLDLQLKSMEDAKGQLSRHILEAEQEKKSLNEQLNAVQHSQGTEQQRNSELAKLNQNLSDRILKLQEEKAGLVYRLSRFQLQLEENERKLGTIKESEIKLKHEVSDLEKCEQGLHKEVKEFRLREIDSQAKIREMQEEVLLLKDQLTKLKHKETTLRYRVQELENASPTAQLNSSQDLDMSVKFNDYQDKILSLTQENQRLKAQIEKYNIGTELPTGVSTNEIRDLKQKAERLAEVESRKEQLEKQNIVLKQELLTLKEKSSNNTKDFSPSAIHNSSGTNTSIGKGSFVSTGHRDSYSSTRGSAGTDTRGSAGTDTRGSAGTNTRGSAGTNTRGSAGTNTRGSAGTDTRGSAGTDTRGSAGTDTRGSAGTDTRGSTHQSDHIDSSVSEDEIFPEFDPSRERVGMVTSSPTYSKSEAIRGIVSSLPKDDVDFDGRTYSTGTEVEEMQIEKVFVERDSVDCWLDNKYFSIQPFKVATEKIQSTKTIQLKSSSSYDDKQLEEEKWGKVECLTFDPFDDSVSEDSHWGKIETPNQSSISVPKTKGHDEIGMDINLHSENSEYESDNSTHHAPTSNTKTVTLFKTETKLSPLNTPPPLPSSLPPSLPIKVSETTENNNNKNGANSCTTNTENRSDFELIDDNISPRSANQVYGRDGNRGDKEAPALSFFNLVEHVEHVQRQLTGEVSPNDEVDQVKWRQLAEETGRKYDLSDEENKHLKDQVNSLDQKVEEQTRYIEILEKLLKTLENLMSQKKSKSPGEITLAVEKAVNNTACQVEQSHMTSHSGVKDNAALTRDLHRKERELASKYNEVGSLKRELEKWQTEFHSVERMRVNALDSLLSLEKEVVTLQGSQDELIDLKQKYNTNQQKLKDLEKKTFDLEETRQLKEFIERENLALKQRLESHGKVDAELALLKGQCEVNEKALKDKLETEKHHLEELKSMERKISELEEALVEKNNICSEMEQIKAQCGQLEEENSEAKRQVSNYQDQLNELTKQCEAKDRQIQSLSSELEKMKVKEDRLPLENLHSNGVNDSVSSADISFQEEEIVSSTQRQTKNPRSPSPASSVSWDGLPARSASVDPTQQRRRILPRARSATPSPMSNGLTNPTQTRYQSKVTLLLQNNQGQGHEPNKKTFVALANYNPKLFSRSNRPGQELKLHEGDTVIVHGEKDENGYYRAEVNGHTGLVPASYLLPLPIDEDVLRSMANRRQQQQHVQRVPSHLDQSPEHILELHSDLQRSVNSIRQAPKSPSPIALTRPRTAPPTTHEARRQLPHVNGNCGPSLNTSQTIPRIQKPIPIHSKSSTLPRSRGHIFEGPPSPPQNFTVERIVGDHGVMLSWQPPELDELARTNGSELAGYMIYLNGRLCKKITSPHMSKTVIEHVDIQDSLKFLIQSLAVNGQTSSLVEALSDFDNSQSFESSFEGDSEADLSGLLSSAQFDKGHKREFLAVYDYSPIEHSPHDYTGYELGFQAGETITVYGRLRPDGFYHGEIKGRRGLVPASFIEEVPYSAHKQRGVSRATLKLSSPRNQ